MQWKSYIIYSKLFMHQLFQILLGLLIIVTSSKTYDCENGIQMEENRTEKFQALATLNKDLLPPLQPNLKKMRDRQPL